MKKTAYGLLGIAPAMQHEVFVIALTPFAIALTLAFATVACKKKEVA